MTHRMLAVLISVAMLGLSLVLVACSGDSSDDSSSPTSPESSSESTSDSASPSAACDALDTLRSDIGTMTSADSVDAFQSGFDQTKSDFDDLKPALEESYGDDVNAVQGALDDFDAELKSSNDQGALERIQALGSAAKDVGDAVRQLASDVDCPS